MGLQKVAVAACTILPVLRSSSQRCAAMSPSPPTWRHSARGMANWVACFGRKRPAELVETVLGLRMPLGEPDVAGDFQY